MYNNLDNQEPYQVAQESAVLYQSRSRDIGWAEVNQLKDISGLKDETLADMLDITVKTFRAYKREGSDLKDHLQEQVLLLIALFHHGIEVFGSADVFEKWLSTENFSFSMEKPIAFLNTVLGIRFVESRLKALEYGDNV